MTDGSGRTDRPERSGSDRRAEDRGEEDRREDDRREEDRREDDRRGGPRRSDGPDRRGDSDRRGPERAEPGRRSDERPDRRGDDRREDDRREDDRREDDRRETDRRTGSRRTGDGDASAVEPTTTDERAESAGDAAPLPDRRAFLRAAGAAGAALGLGALPAAGAEPVEPPAGGAGPAGRAASPYLWREIPDVAVVGAGAFGAWTAYYLRQQGVEVMLVDKYGPGNSKSTSGGETRGVRSSYGNRETSDLWGRWANEAIRRWKEYDEAWRDRTPTPLFYTTGDVIMREEMEPFLEDNQTLWDGLGVEYEVLDGDEVHRRWPVIDTTNVAVALYEPQAGVVRARRAIETVARVFQDEGGRLRVAEARTGGRADDGRLWDLELDGGERLRAGSFVFALGPWFPKVFPELLGQRMRIPMGHVFYYGTPGGDHRFSFPNLPSYNVPGVTGWPALPPDNRGFRVRTGGTAHDDPDTSPRWVPEERMERPRQVLRDYFPAMGDAPLVETRTCHYEISISRNFIIDRHPDYSNVWLAGGGSAEAFKFGPVTGEYVAMRVMGLDGDPEIAAGFRIPEEEYEETTG